MTSPTVRRGPAAAFGPAVLAGVLVAGVLVAAGCPPAGPATAPPPLNRVPPDLPTFDPEEKGETAKDRPAFNRFSWQDFLALNWPAADDRRGVPHPTARLGAAADRVVWESWKSLDELYPDDPTRVGPTPWDSYEAALSVPVMDANNKQKRLTFKELDRRGAGRVKLLAQSARLSEVNQAGTGVFDRGPLVAQSGAIVRYETRVNRVAYDHIRDNRYDLRDRRPADLRFPDQSIHVKAAWVELPGDAAVRRRFYHVTAKVVVGWGAGDPPEPVLADRVVGLVGLHIVHKTPNQRDWVWSTFEHVDNLLTEDGPGTPPATFSAKRPPLVFGTAGANVEPTPLKVGDAFPSLSPVEVVRRTPVAEATAVVNHWYQSHPEVKGTVWRNYKLVGTQWPRRNGPTRGTGNEGNRLPEEGLANVTMETYTQGLSCLACHAKAKRNEFAFYPTIRAYPVPKDGE